VTTRTAQAFRRTCVLFLSVLALLAVMVHASWAMQSPVLFADDFSSSEIGGTPAGWFVEGEPGSVEVVCDAGLDSGRAVHIVADPNRRETRMTAPLDQALSAAAVTIAVEHQLRWVAGKGVNLYVSQSGPNLNWYVTDTGQLGFRASKGDSSYGVSCGVLKDGWNHLRIIANRKTNEAYLYLNDMERPVAGPLAFRQPVSTWKDARLTVQHTHNDLPGDVYYGGFRVWAMDDEAPNLVPVRNATWTGDRPKRPAPSLPPWPSTSSGKRQVSLRVTEDQGLVRINQPVTSGVPLAEGQLWNPALARLLRDGQEVPLQASVLSRWPDGSIRWLLLDFQADLVAGETAEYVLEYGSTVAASPYAGIVVEEDHDTVTVATGRLEVTFGKQSQLIRGLKVDGVPWEGLQSPKLVLQGSGGLVISTSSAPYQLMVEEVGPERVVVLVKGELHEMEGGETLNFAYDMRFHFYRNATRVRIDPTITHLMGWEPRIAVSHAKITDVSLSFPGWLRGSQAIFDIATAREQISSGQAASVALLQTTERNYEIISDGRQIAAGDRAPGWAQFRQGDRSLTAGVRHFWEHFPKGIVLNEDGDLRVQLWAASADPLIMGGGEAKRHEIYLDLSDQGAAAVAGLLHPLRAVASPSWYSSTHGFGRPFLLIEDGHLPLYNPSIAMYETFVEQGYVRLAQNRDRLGEYGWRNFGDWSTTWDPDGWGNGEYDLAYVYFQQFARSGDLRYFDLAESAARHWMDVDLVWAAYNDVWVGCGHSHSASHRSYAGEHHTWNQGLLDYYHLTGDRRSLEAALAVGDFFAHLALVKPDRHRPRIFQNQQRDVGTRSAGWALVALVAAYESTCDPYYLKAAEAVVEILAEEQQPDGQWTYTIAANEAESQPNATKPFMTAIILRGLGDYHRVTQDARAAEMLIRGLTHLVDELWCETALGYPYIDHPDFAAEARNTNMLLLDAFAYAYELTGNERFREVALKGFEATLPHQMGQLAGSNLGKTVAQTLRHTAQSLAVLTQPREIVLSGPSSVSVGCAGAEVGCFRVTRLDDTGSLRGTLQIRDLPDGLQVTPAEITYTLEPGVRAVPLELAIAPTKELPPGAYPVTLCDPGRPELDLSFSALVPGWRIVDDFRPPLTNSWFGDLAYQVRAEESEGWRYEITDPDQFFGDANRLCRSEPSAEYLVYDVPGLFDFELTFYTLVSGAEETADGIQIQFSVGNDEWKEIPLHCSWTAQGDLAKGVLTPTKRYFRGDGQLKISVLSGGDPAFPQIGRLEVTGWQ
jgi:hypothetical protein